MNHPAVEITPDEFARCCTYVQEALRRWRLDPDWIVDGQPGAADGPEAALRQRRQLESVRILWRDVTGAASLEETGRALADLAAECLETALAEATAEVGRRAGQLLDEDDRPQQLCVIGLGKLGGAELNFNSDLDLVFVHDARGESTGPRRLPAREYLGQVARVLIRLLDTVTDAGRVWVIDTRLRPFGQSGALVWSQEAMEQYFVNEGRSWERYAWMKAREVAGDLNVGNELIRRLQPFIFRRYLDYGLFDSLRKLHNEIDRKGRREGFANDIKSGPGGIRELEFLVQSLQLLRGGRDPALQTPNFLEALNAARDRQLMDSQEAGTVENLYRFLRILENRLQGVTGRQTHELVQQPDQRARLARIMAEPDWPALQARIDTVRDRVAELFRTRFGEPLADPGNGPTLWPPDGELRAGLEQAGFEEPDAANRALERLARRLARRPQSAEARRRLDALMPGLLSAVIAHRRPDTGFEDLLALIENIARRSAYLALLRERPETLERLVRVYRRSARLAAWITHSPHLLDDLLDPVRGFGLPAAPEMNSDDPESSLEALGRFRQAGFVRTALGQLDGSLDRASARGQLTRLAEQVIECVLELVTPSGSPPLAVIGYGNLGAGELHYSSDLDLVFLHRRGEAPVRLAQKLIGAMQLPLAGGKLYDIDTRLRPNGNAGLLVSTVKSFDAYQHQHAWTWEHQALIRARWVAGDPEVAEPVEVTRRRVLCQDRDATATRRALIDMRRRQRRERREDPIRAVHADVQFIAELGILLSAGRHPELIDQRRVEDQLRALAGIGWLDTQLADSLIHASHAASAVRDREFLERTQTLHGDDQTLAETVTGAVEQAWREVFGADRQR